jgi:parallel beta-helix repeat protein
MRARRITLAALSAFSTVGAAAGLAPTVAHADTATTIYVDNGSAQCSDTGSGTEAAPFCTVQAAGNAATPGSTVLIEPGSGAYTEPNQLLTHSGSAGSPITFQPAQGTVTLAGLRFDQGVHDIVIKGLDFTGGLWVDESSARFTVTGNHFHGGGAGIDMYDGEAMVISHNVLDGGGIWAEGAVNFGGSQAEPTPTLIDDNTVTGGQIGVQVGSATIVHNTVTDGFADGVVIGSDMVNSDTVAQAQIVVADNLIAGNKGAGVLTYGYFDTITGNTIADNGGNQIEVHPHTVENYTPNPLPIRHIENNIIATGTALPHQAAANPAFQAGIAIDQAAWVNAAIDDNVVDMPTGVPYQVGSTLIPDGAHLAALGHGGLHEVGADPLLNADGTLKAGSPAIDSADSAAAGETDTDLLGNARRDDTGVCDTGTGTRTYDDRGAFEFQGTTSPAVDCAAPVTAMPTPTPPTVSSIDFPASGSYFGVGRPGTIKISGTASGVASVRYSIDGGATLTAAADSSGSASVPFTAQSAGQHWIDAQTVGPDGTSMVTRYVFTVPATDSVGGPTAYAEFTPGAADKHTVSLDMVRSLHGTTPIQSYAVDFGDGASSGPGSATTASHTYSVAKTYPVTVTVTDTDGMTATAHYTYSAVTGQVTADVSTPTPTTVHVDDAAGANCANTGAGAGSAATPYCSISAAVATAVPAETIEIAPGTYNETVNVTRSGVPGSPITLHAAPGTVTLNGQNIGGSVVVSLGTAHDVTVSGLTISTPGQTAVSAGGQNVTVRDSSMTSTQWGGTDSQLVTFRGVHNGAIIGNTVTGGQIGGISVDASSSRITVQGNTVSSASAVSDPTISVAAPDSSVIANTVHDSNYTSISVAGTADRSVVADNLVTCTRYGQGISVAASHTAVTGNTIVQGNNNTELLIAGPVTGDSVQNNIVAQPGATAGFDCVNSGFQQVGISVDAQATAGTTVDYNDVATPLGEAYVWGAQSFTNIQLAAFRQASGQGAHDSTDWLPVAPDGTVPLESEAIDSANSAAPGEQLTDLRGHARVDDPNTPDTGAGPRNFDDRGAVEYQPPTSPGGGGTPPPPTNPPPTTPPPTNPPPANPGQPVVSRLSGGDRYATSVDVSRAQWHDGTAGAVVIATGGNFPDALSGVPLAAHVHGPLLLTDPKAMDTATAAEITRVLGGDKSKTVYILGGTGAVSADTERQVRALGYQVKRLSGNDRYATSLAVAKAFGPSQHVIVATGQSFADALSAGPLGAVEGAPVVLSQDTHLDADTAAFVRGHAAVEAVGGQAVAAVAALGAGAPSVTPLAGKDRYLTSTAVAAALGRALGHPVTGAGIASGMNFPDALTGGAYAANAGMPLLLTDPKSLPGTTGDLLGSLASHLVAVTLFGGPAAISPDVEGAIAARVHGRLG